MRRTLVLATLLAAAGVAHGQPGKPMPPTGKVPMRSVPCAMEDELELREAGGDPVLCWKGGCMQLDPGAGTARAVPRPPPPKPWLMPVPEVKADAVCLGATCKRLGRKLAAAVAEERKGDHPNVLATTDLKAVAVGSSAWDVGADRPLKLKPAPERGRDKPEVVGVGVAGPFLVIHGAACAGPCTTSQIADSGGRHIGKGGGGGGPVFQVNARTFALVAEYAAVQFYDLKTGKQTGQLALRGGPSTWSAVRLDESKIGVVHETNGTHMMFEAVTVPEGRSEPMVLETMSLPKCAP